MSQDKARPSFVDSPEQAAVIQAPVGADLLVVAGAGSGKTYTMTRRIIELIGRGVAPERILGLTFTNKAASELLSRVSAAVAADRQAQAGGPDIGQPSKQSGEGGRREATSRSGGIRDMAISQTFLKPQISTYDAFFQTLVRQYGLLVGFDQQTQPLSEAGPQQLIANVLERHLDLLVEEQLGAFSTVVDKVHALSDAIASAMIGPGCSDMDQAMARIRAWDQAFSDQLDQALGDEQAPQEEPVVSSKPPKRRKKDSDQDHQRRLEEYQAAWHQRCLYRCGQLKTVVHQREVLLTLVEEYQQEKRRQNMAEFSDFTIAAYQLVSRFPSIGQTYRHRFSHVLLDEYQDTSTTQANLLAALFHGGQTGAAAHTDSAQAGPDQTGSADPLGQIGLTGSLGQLLEDLGPVVHTGAGAGASSHPLTGRANQVAVSAVGDPFQSIYAWRGASPGAFRLFQSNFGMAEGGKPYPLSVTRRNSQLVLEAANNLTAPLRLPERRPSSAREGEVSVQALRAMDTAPLGSVGVLGLETLGQEIDAVARFAKESIRLSQAAQEAGTSSQSEGADGSAGGRQSPSGAGPKVAVLFRTKSDMPAFAQGLQAAGLTCSMVGYSALLERPEVRDLLALLHLLADHTDSAHLMRLLATPRFGLGAEDLAALARLADRQNTRYRFRALAEAGLVPADAPQSQWSALIKDHQDQVANALFLVDLLSRQDLDELLEQSQAISPQGKAGIARMGRVLNEAQASFNEPLSVMVQRAVEALGLDVDLVLAQAINRPGQPVCSSQALSALEAVCSLVDDYSRELPEGVPPTLRGFVAWVDALSQVDDKSSAQPDTPADVMLMTIHQSKGLEWDAVAVVGMADGSFPSRQGDSLSVKEEDGHPGRLDPASGLWTPPQYQSTASTWLTNPAAVPVPVRVDTAILPSFPHNANDYGDALTALQELDGVERVEDEVFGQMRQVMGLDEEGQGRQLDRDGWYLSQQEEYGRRIHADERRLAYVALTRARRAALLTYSHLSALSRNPGQSTGQSSQPSNFWTEVFESLKGRDGIFPAPHQAAQEAEGTTEHGGDPSTGTARTGMSLTDLGAGRPAGFFAGEQAQHYWQLVVDQAWEEPLEASDQEETLPWPASSSPRVSRILTQGAQAVRRALADHQQADAGSDPLASWPVDSRIPERESLLERAKMLVADHDLMPWSATGADDKETLDRQLRQKGQRLLARSRQNVTSLQARAGLLGPQQARNYWRGLIRPIPQVASPAAQAGTIFHAWAEAFLKAVLISPDEELLGLAVAALPADAGALAQGEQPVAQTRESLLADLARREAEANPAGHAPSVGPDQTGDLAADGPVSTPAQTRAGQAHSPQHPDGRQAARLLQWERRLADSRWARRRPAAVERQIVASIPELDGTIVNGKLDAVFYGGLDEGDGSKTYTIIDWKTGRRPRKEEDINGKLLQLDLYRLLLSAMTGVPLASIDASLYYVSESREDLRELRAQDKDKQTILSGLSMGIPQESDDE
ncbi:ATP-dependent DNA helicase [Bifidobacterium aemilianum]|uniref:DNA 3'-5' helicase n=1 Tax=Bifidobacterium aemilianum TaxID=2493120 RepID=A0A366KAA4_9BIFI|nr:ATP-dependent helicase [Bifidobacterium aemilianum]RBP98644.1 ATP-dependent DNA helicase [Bifidobacterium aemilianum]